MQSDNRRLYHIYLSIFLFSHLNRTIRLISSYYSKFIPYELAEESNRLIDHELQQFEINWLNSFRLS